MIDWTWITTTGTAALMVVLTALGIYLALVLLTRLAGLRSFSKMSSHDFAVTVAIGSVIASVLLAKDPPLLQGIVGLAALYAIQMGVSALRPRLAFVRRLVDNEPLLLMAGPEILHDNLKTAQVTLEDLRAKLREANVIHPEQIRAVVMEATGDVSVLHADTGGPALDLSLFDGVRGIEHLRRRDDIKETDDALNRAG